jgi:excisionase family DNA binding protein
MSAKLHAPLYTASAMPAVPATTRDALASALVWDLVAAEMIAARPPDDEDDEEHEDNETPDGEVAKAVRLFSVAEAAELLAVSPATVYALCARKRVRHERHGQGRGTIRIPAEAIEEYRRGVTVAVERGADDAPPTPLRHIRY